MKRCLACDETFEAEDWCCPACNHTPAERNGLIAFSPELDDATTGYDPTRYEHLAEIEPNNFWFVARNRLITDALQRFFGDRPRSFLEVGCGTGFVLSAIASRFPGWTLRGSEIHAEGLSFAAERVPRAELFQMDARAIPFRSDLDVIGAFDVIEHIEEDERVLAEMAQALRPDGGLILTVPQHPRLWSAHDEAAHHKRRYTRSELKEKVTAAGFRVERITSFVSLLLPAMLGYRAGRRAFGRDSRPSPTFGVEAGLHLGPALNALLSGVMSIERGFIRAGGSLPLGGSLLLVARKTPSGRATVSQRTTD